MTKTDPISQEALIRIFEPLFQEFAVRARKTATVLVRPANADERVATITSDGLETMNTAAQGDFIIKNRTKAAEEYVLTQKLLEERYQPTGQQEDGWDEMRPTSETQVLELTAERLLEAGLSAPFYFMARWNEAMIAKENDYLAATADFSEMYRIAREAFEETYQTIGTHD